MFQGQGSCLGIDKEFQLMNRKIEFIGGGLWKKLYMYNCTSWYSILKCTDFIVYYEFMEKILLEPLLVQGTWYTHKI
jgi:hypothetical protein